MLRLSQLLGMQQCTYAALCLCLAISASSCSVG